LNCDLGIEVDLIQARKLSPCKQGTAATFSLLPRSEFRVLFPFRNATPRRPIVGDKLDRYALLNSARLFAGLQLNRDFTRLSAALIVTEGRGKYLRVQHLEVQSNEVPASLAQGLQEQARSPNGNWPPLLSDLAEFQAAEFDRLKRVAGKFVDRILCLAVGDPGLWLQDFDGRRTYLSACDPCKLSELTGVSVVDGFPARDLAAGGNGSDLAGLPLWLWLADRPQKAARQSTGLILLDANEITAWFLPGSDGLDEVLPDIERMRLENGRLSGEHLATAISAFFQRPRKESLPLSQLFFAVNEGGSPTPAVAIASQLGLEAELLPLLPEQFSRPEIASAVATTILGGLFVDQMPGNVPALSGAGIQRILGRITPGSPASWRNLLINMTDSQAPTMKLRDAV
jgi:hypothetical protein